MKITEFQEANTSGNAFVTTMLPKASICSASLEF